MLIRRDNDDAILITQPAHAWVSGQLARAWTHDEFAPFEDVCLAAEQHDIGWLTWESNPTLNRMTGLPHTFRELDRKTHLQLWARARRYAVILGRYPALLVSMHGTGLYERFGPGPDAPESERTLVDSFLRRERSAQQQLIDSLAQDDYYEPFVDSDALRQNQHLIGLWDGMSLMLCGGIDQNGATIGDFNLTPGDEPEVVTADPWPFGEDHVDLTVEGRRVTGPFERPAQLAGALQRAEWVRLGIRLVPADGSSGG